jgi:hypothetical protein
MPISATIVNKVRIYNMTVVQGEMRRYLVVNGASKKQIEW